MILILIIIINMRIIKMRIYSQNKKKRTTRKALAPLRAVRFFVRLAQNEIQETVRNVKRIEKKKNRNESCTLIG